jgi:integrase
LRQKPSSSASFLHFDSCNGYRTAENANHARHKPYDIARLVQRVTKAAGIEGDFAAHSLRAGFITSAASTKGVSEVDIQAVSGHRSITILRGYVRRANVFVDAPATAMFGSAD